MQDSLSLASSCIKSISSFLTEFEASQINPNVVFMNKEHFEAIKQCFPYLLDELVLTYGKHKLQIIISQNLSVGVALSYYTDYLVNSK